MSSARGGTPRARDPGRVRLALLLVVLAALGGRAAAAPSVVASIKPLHSLVSGVTDGVLVPALLLDGGASPHSYALRPTAARVLAQADLVFWIGKPLELFLERPLGALAARAQVVAVLDAPGLTVLRVRTGSAWAGHAHAHEEPDPHVWLSPVNAARMVEHIAAALVELDPANAAAYRRNAQVLQQRLEALDAELAQRLAPLAVEPYLVFHDAFQYLEQRYGLRALGAVTPAPERAAGAGRITELRALIVASGARCIFHEPQFAPRLEAALAEGLAVRADELDPLGADLQAGPEQYFELLRGNAAALSRCLARPAATPGAPAAAR